MSEFLYEIGETVYFIYESVAIEAGVIKSKIKEVRLIDGLEAIDIKYVVELDPSFHVTKYQSELFTWKKDVIESLKQLIEKA